jgi:hypothetical protein
MTTRCRGVVPVRGGWCPSLLVTAASHLRAAQQVLAPAPSSSAAWGAWRRGVTGLNPDVWPGSANEANHSTPLAQHPLPIGRLQLQCAGLFRNLCIDGEQLLLPTPALATAVGQWDAYKILGSWFLGNRGQGQEPQTRCPTTIRCYSAAADKAPQRR